jgi:RimJ/RimL family protein N-acetyltransferase
VTATPSAAGISDERILIRSLAERDIAAYLEAFEADFEMARLIGFDDDPTEANLRARIERPDEQRVELVIADRPSDALLGSLWLHAFDPRHRRLEIGFWIAPHARRRGIARRAVALTIDWAFAQAGIERVEITTTPDNLAVQQLAEQLGFTREGLLRDRHLERGQRVSLYIFGLLRDEWPASRLLGRP